MLITLGYSGLLFSSNVALFACDSKQPQTYQDFEEPRVTMVPSESAPGEVPAARPARSMGSDARCHEGLISGPDLDVDVHRLGVLCGPTSGLEPFGQPFKLRVTAPLSVASVDVEGTECLRAFVASASGEPLELEWRSPERVFTRCSVGRLGSCPADEPHCIDTGRGETIELAVVSPFPNDVAGRIWHRARR